MCKFVVRGLGQTPPESQFTGSVLNVPLRLEAAPSSHEFGAQPAAIAAGQPGLSAIRC